jgi:hypothetical protein
MPQEFIPVLTQSFFDSPVGRPLALSEASRIRRFFEGEGVYVRVRRDTTGLPSLIAARVIPAPWPAPPRPLLTAVFLNSGTRFRSEIIKDPLGLPVLNVEDRLVHSSTLLTPFSDQPLRLALSLLALLRYPMIKPAGIVAETQQLFDLLDPACELKTVRSSLEAISFAAHARYENLLPHLRCQEDFAASCIALAQGHFKNPLLTELIKRLRSGSPETFFDRALVIQRTIIDEVHSFLNGSGHVAGEPTKLSKLVFSHWTTLPSLYELSASGRNALEDLASRIKDLALDLFASAR